jgi:hypothetical protein
MPGGESSRRNPKEKKKERRKRDDDGDEILTYSKRTYGGETVLIPDPKGELDEDGNKVDTWVASENYQRRSNGKKIKRRPGGNLDGNGVRISHLTQRLRQPRDSESIAPQRERSRSAHRRTRETERAEQDDREARARAEQEEREARARAEQEEREARARAEQEEREARFAANPDQGDAPISAPPSYGSHNGIRVAVGGGERNVGAFRHQENAPSFSSKPRDYNQSTGRTLALGHNFRRAPTFGGREETLTDSSDGPHDSIESNSGSYPSASSGVSGVFQYSTDEETRAAAARAKAKGKGKAIAEEDPEEGSSRKKSSTRHKAQVSVSSTDSEPRGPPPRYDASKPVDIAGASTHRKTERKTDRKLDRKTDRKTDDRKNKPKENTEKESTHRERRSDGNGERRHSRSRGEPSNTTRRPSSREGTRDTRRRQSSREGTRDTRRRPRQDTSGEESQGGKSQKSDTPSDELYDLSL